MKDVGKQLFDKETTIEKKKAILMTLAHEGTEEAVAILEKYNKEPDEEIEVFSEIALAEGKWWSKG